MSDDQSRMIFGYAVLVAIWTLCIVIGLGKVTQENSFGLDNLMGCLTTLSGGFAVYAFTKGNKDA